MLQKTGHIIVIGAGVGGLATAMRLAAAGYAVTVLEQHDHVGGKMRTVATEAGPADAGPTVLTMRHVFDELFHACHENLTDHLELVPAEVLARHWWADGTTLDLTPDMASNHARIREVFGKRDAQAFDDLSARAARLFSAFDAPMMQRAEPGLGELTQVVLRNPGLIRDMKPHQTLHRALRTCFDAPHLVQLFGRYATYVGGSPYEAPALLSLIWYSEASGVWAVKGGMHRLADAMSTVVGLGGGDIRLGCGVKRLELQNGRAAGVVLNDGTRLSADAVVFNGDPRALAQGLLGDTSQTAVSAKHVSPRSLSAHVWAFAARPKGVDLAHHNVFFADDPEVEFSDLAAGRTPRDATLYVCAQDRGTDGEKPANERFEIIRNGPPVDDADVAGEEDRSCHMQTFRRLDQMGLSFDRVPPPESMTTPQDFNRLFPGSNGSLYGRSPHGMTAALSRPTARTAIPGLYLAGGGAHPGAGVPMAALSGRHSAEAIMTDLTSTFMSRPMAMRGGMSMGSATMAAAQSRSSAS